MTTEQFTYWLQGFFELSGATTLNEEQVKVIKEHIALVLKKTTPSSVNGVWYFQGNGPYINPDIAESYFANAYANVDYQGRKQHSPTCGWHSDWHNCNCGVFSEDKK